MNRSRKEQKQVNQGVFPQPLKSRSHIPAFLSAFFAWNGALNWKLFFVPASPQFYRSSEGRATGVDCSTAPRAVRNP
jgi:hypothetical protein